MVAGDFNGDGNQDVVVLPSGGNFVRVFLGHGDGTFAAPVSISAGLTAGDMVVGDFNGDNKADIALANSTSVSVLLGKSGGTLQTAIVTKTGPHVGHFSCSGGWRCESRLAPGYRRQRYLRWYPGFARHRHGAL